MDPHPHHPYTRGLNSSFNPCRSPTNQSANLNEIMFDFMIYSVGDLRFTIFRCESTKTSLFLYSWGLSLLLADWRTVRCFTPNEKLGEENVKLKHAQAFMPFMLHHLDKQILSKTSVLRNSCREQSTKTIKKGTLKGAEIDYVRTGWYQAAVNQMKSWFSISTRT